jgi:hypothetical protein
MAYWDGKKIAYWKTKPCKYYPAWDEIDCGCCAGIEWGGEEPRECKRCGGSGGIYRHRRSGVTAGYPGGRFV